MLAQDFRPREWFIPDGSWLREAFRIEDRYFGGSQTRIDFYTKAPPPGESYFSLQDELAAIPPTLLDSPYMSAIPPFISWYDLFLEWLGREKPPSTLDPAGRPPRQADAMTWLVEWLATPQGAAFENDVVFNADRTDLLSSRMTGFSNEFEDAPWAVELTRDVRARVRQAAPSLDAIAFSRSFFNYDGFDVVTSLTVRNVIAAAVAVFIVMLILLVSAHSEFTLALPCSSCWRVCIGPLSSASCCS